MRLSRKVLISFAILACVVVPQNLFALTALDLSKYLPDQVGEFYAAGEVSREDISKDNGMFYRAQRLYSSKKGTICILAVLKGTDVPKIIEETFAKGSKIKIENFDAVNIPPENNVVAASVKLDKDFLITAAVINSKDKEVPIKILKKLKLVDLSTLSKKQ